nr:retrovirus-related Pol polyprotein from transposon TNT 1-94 [Tanacetum cinerariifolium]
MQASLQGKDNAIRQLKKQLSELQATSRDTKCTVKVRTTDSQLTKLAHTPIIRKKQDTVTKPSNRQDSNKNKHVVTQKIQKTNVPVPHSTGVKRCPKVGGSQPKSNHKTNRISLAKGDNKLPVEDLPRTNKSHLRTTNHVDSNSRLKRTVINSNSNSICQTCNKCLTSFDHDMCVAVYVKSVVLPHSTRHNCKVERRIKQVVQIVLWYLDSGCSKHMTGDRSRLLNFMKKFIGTVRFGNDHFGAIMVMVITWLVKASSLGHDEVLLNHLNFGTINDLARKDLFRGLPRLKFENDHLCSASARTMLIFSKAPMFLWAEAVATTCYTQNRSLIHSRQHKTPYELVHNKKPDLTFFRVFGALCYPTNDSEDLGKLQPTADTGIFVGYAPSRKGYRIYNKRT